MPLANAPDADSALLTLQSTGMTRWDALVQLADGGIVHSVLDGIPQALLRAWSDVDEAVTAYRIQAEIEPVGCDAFPTEFLRDRTVDRLALGACCGLTSLPPGLKVLGNLDLEGCRDLRSLPDDIAIGGWLDLKDCSRLVSLPRRLTIGKWLDLTGCASWDGRIPADAMIAGKVMTDAHGTLERNAWRMAIGC
jgi:hypothetical protein